MTQVSIQSLREIGKYEGDILVFSDGTFSGCEGVSVHKVERLKHRSDRLYSKVFFAERIDVQQYDKVMLCDSDCVAVGDLSALFRSTFAGCRGGLEYSFITMLQFSCGGRLMKNTKERLAARLRWGINTGLLCWDSRYFHRDIRNWGREIRSRQRQATYCADQPFFNYLVFKNRIKFKEYPRNWVGFPWHQPGEEFSLQKEHKVLHFIGNHHRPADKVKFLEAFLKLLKSTRSRQKLSEFINQQQALGGVG